MGQSPQHDDAGFRQRRAREAGRQGVGVERDRLVLGVNPGLSSAILNGIRVSLDSEITTRIESTSSD